MARQGLAVGWTRFTPEDVRRRTRPLELHISGQMPLFFLRLVTHKLLIQLNNPLLKILLYQTQTRLQLRHRFLVPLQFLRPVTLKLPCHILTRLIKILQMLLQTLFKLLLGLSHSLIKLRTYMR